MTALSDALDALLGPGRPAPAASAAEYTNRLAALSPMPLLDACLAATPTELAEMCEESHPHVNGFAKLSLPARPGHDARLRLHAWDTSPTIAPDAHNHRWPLLSRVLAGALRNSTYAVRPGSSHRHFRHSVDTPGFGNATLIAGELVDLAKLSETDHPAGAVYSLSPDEIHNAEPTPANPGPTVTLALELPPIRTSTDIYTTETARSPGPMHHPPRYTPDDVMRQLRHVRRTLTVEAFRATMRTAYLAPTFKHHRWYVPYHLDIMERLATEFRAHHPGADPHLINAMVWMHDYGKALHNSPAKDVTLREGRLRLLECGADEAFADQVVTGTDMVDRATELDLTQAPAEVRIVSSADACAHLTGPFFHLYWWENPDRPLADLMADNRRKLDKDWHRKVVLPEAREAFAARYRVLREQSGELPARFLA